MYDVAIVGGGPAGLTAAIYARRANKQVVVFEATNCGGQIINSEKIDNYPAAPHISGLDFSQKLTEQVEELGVEIVYEQVQHVTGSYGDFQINTDSGECHAKTVILACGTDTRKMGLEREDELTGKGISYCATCDGHFFKGKDVAVYGGGNTALHEAIYLADVSRKVYLVNRRDDLRASADLIAKAKKKDNIEFVLGATIDQLSGEKKLESVTLNTGKKLEISALFVAIGRVPNIVGIVPGLKLDANGYADSDDSCETNILGLYVAGDMRNKAVRQLVTATSDGAVAAVAALDQLNNPTPRDERYKEWLKLYKIAGIGLKEGGLAAAKVSEYMGIDYPTAVKYIDALDKINVAHSDLKNPVGHSVKIGSLQDFPNPDGFDSREGDEFLESL
ncbi:FAD-dependent oxidoreductase [Candidatus Saccharibacteria bacterium]|nr:FAD-dependent oxidoreductase [Candidatus Saccharibacteria bacterium]